MENMDFCKKNDGWESSKKKIKEKYDLGILILRFAYVIMPVGKNDVSIHIGMRKAPETQPPGLFYSVLSRWLIPQAGYLLSSPSSHLQI